MYFTGSFRFLSTRGRALLQGALASALLAAPLAHAGFTNGGFEADTAMPPSDWTVKTYSRTGLLPVSPPPSGATLLDLGLTSESLGSAVSAVVTTPVFNVPATNPGTLTAPRWGSHAFKLNDQGSRVASSIEQMATMTLADVDPVDGKIHVRFGMAPVLVDGGHGPTEQPYFYVRVHNITKGTELFHTYNYANQSGVPWQTSGSYRYTDWQGFDISPGNGLLDVGDQVRLIIYAANCQPSAAAHEARVYLDAVSAFMPGLAVTATGPSTTKPGETIAYTYNYSNGSGAFALGTKVRVAAPKTENGLFTTFAPGSWPPYCTGPHTGTAPRADYLECDVGDLTNGASGSFGVSFVVPAGAATTGPNNVVNNGDYDIRANTVSPFIGPLIKTTILPLATPTTDLGVTVDNGGKISYLPSDTPVYTFTVTNHSANGVTGASVSQTLSGVAGGTWACSVPPGSTASCGATASGSGPISTNTADIPAGQELVYTYTGGTPTGAGTPANTVVTVSPPAGTQDSQLSNNTAGLNTPVSSAQQNVTVKAAGSGTGGVLSVPAPLSCAAPCSSTGVTQSVGQGDEVRLTAVADPGSIFKGWTGCTSVTGNLCVITVGATGVTATAEFAKAYIVTPTQSGGNGSIGPASPQQVEEGGAQVFTLTPSAGYLPVITPPASGTTCPGTLNTAVVPNTYTVSPVTANCGFTVAFSAGVTLTSSVSGGNGTISPLGATGPLPPGNNNTVYTLTPSAGYTPVVGGTCPGTVSGNTYTVTNASADCTVVASFTNDPVSVTSSVSGSGGGISTVGTVNLPRGGSRTYTLTPNPGFYPLITGNCPGTLVGNTYTVSPVNANCAFSVAYTSQTVNITATATGGTITPPGTTTVARGGGLTYTATPTTPGDVPVFSGTCPGTVSGNTYTVANATSNCVVDVKFIAPASAVVVTTNVPGGNGTVTTPGQNGAGQTMLASGDSRVWTVTPAPGYVPRLAAGSTCTGTLSATAPYTYTLNNVTANCVANFTFVPAGSAAIPTLNEWGILLLSALMGLAMVGMRSRRTF